MKTNSFINQDYLYRIEDAPGRGRKISRPLLLLVGGALIGIVAALVFIPDDARATRPKKTATEDPSHQVLKQHVTAPITLPEPSAAPTLPAVRQDQTPQRTTQPARIEQRIEWRTVKVKRGDNLAAIFSRLGVSAKQLHEIMSLGDDTKKLKRIYPGDIFKVSVNSSSELQILNYELNDTQKLEIRRTKEGFEAETVLLPLDTRLAYASGTINSSLFVAAQKAGLTDKLTMELAGIFGWDIDFALDIREGDHFAVLYEELYRHGEKLKNGNIVAAEFTNRGDAFEAIRFTPENGRTEYYTPEGLSMRKTFLRTPVEFTRISSRFSTGRKHPVLNRIRAHKGVDYAAPTGTPVQATGDGKIIHRGRKGGYGKTVAIQHGNQYSTLYAHLSSYARGARSGSRVRQGQVIGYVGQTGLATGPHLHYEFRLNGVHRNPLTVRFPNADPLPKHYESDFQRVVDSVLATMDSYKQTRVALNRSE